MNSSAQKLSFISMEGEKFLIDSRFIEMSGLIRNMLEDNDNYTEDIPMPSIPSSFLKDIFEYCTHYNFVKVPNIPKPLPSNNLAQELNDPWEAQFIMKYDLEGLIKMIEHSNFLDIPAIFELSCAAVGAMFKGKNFEQVKKDFGLEDETFTPEEEEELQKRFPWIQNEVQAAIKKLEGNPPPIKQPGVE
eukprot:403373179